MANKFRLWSKYAFGFTVIVYLVMVISLAVQRGLYEPEHIHLLRMAAMKQIERQRKEKEYNAKAREALCKVMTITSGERPLTPAERKIQRNACRW